MGSPLVSPSRTPVDAHLSDPSPPLGADAEPTGPSPQPPASEPPRDEDEDEDEAEPSPAEDGDVAAAPLLPEAGGGTPPEAGSQEETPWDHPDAKRPQSSEENPAQPEGPTELSGQEFTFLEVSGWGEPADPPPSWQPRSKCAVGTRPPCAVGSLLPWGAIKPCGMDGGAGGGLGPPVLGADLPPVCCAGHGGPGQHRVPHQSQPGPQAEAPCARPPPRGHL